MLTKTDFKREMLMVPAPSDFVMPFNRKAQGQCSIQNEQEEPSNRQESERRLTMENLEIEEDSLVFVRHQDQIHEVRPENNFIKP